jgi:polyphosphate kinase
MGRNLNRRVESLVRIDKKSHKEYLQEIIDLGLSDEVSSWHLVNDQWIRHTKSASGENLKKMHSLFAKRFKNEKQSS